MTSEHTPKRNLQHNVGWQSTYSLDGSPLDNDLLGEPNTRMLNCQFSVDANNAVLEGYAAITTFTSSYFPATMMFSDETVTQNDVIDPPVSLEEMVVPHTRSVKTHGIKCSSTCVLSDSDNVRVELSFTAAKADTTLKVFSANTHIGTIDLNEPSQSLNNIDITVEVHKGEYRIFLRKYISVNQGNRTCLIIVPTDNPYHSLRTAFQMSLTEGWDSLIPTLQRLGFEAIMT